MHKVFWELLHVQVHELRYDWHGMVSPQWQKHEKLHDRHHPQIFKRNCGAFCYSGVFRRHLNPDTYCNRSEKILQLGADLPLLNYAINSTFVFLSRFRVRKISPKFSCIKFFQSGTSRPKSRDIPAAPCLKQQKQATRKKVLSGISRRLGPGCPRNIPPKNFMFRLFFSVFLVCGGWRIASPDWWLVGGMVCIHLLLYPLSSSTPSCPRAAFAAVLPIAPSHGGLPGQ